jgi:hypothetical protein
MKLAILHNPNMENRSLMEIDFEPSEQEKILLDVYSQRHIYRSAECREGSSDYVLAMYFEFRHGTTWTSLPVMTSDIEEIPIDQDCICSACEKIREDYIGYAEKDFDFIIETADIESDTESFYADKMTELFEFMKMRAQNKYEVSNGVRAKVEKLDINEFVSRKKQKK